MSNPSPADSPPLPTVRTIAALRETVSAWRSQGLRVGFVPTMGALHEGHLSLVRLLRERCDRVLASVFVNPKQFAAHEDLHAYPRDEAGDAAKLVSAGCDLLYAPEPGQMYPAGFSTAVSVAQISEPLEGEARPHFFTGVATVVTKLLIQAMPDAAAFGEKDYQQLVVIRRLTRDLDLPIEILAGETVREPDGLAMSSRNAYLNEAEREIAGRMNVILRHTVAELEAGAPVDTAVIATHRALHQAGFKKIDYVAVRGAEDFGPVPSLALDRPSRLLAAAYAGRTRILDNFPVNPPE